MVVVARRNGNARKRGAFTLVELLMIVALIALLVTVLLPTLGRAIRVARRNATRPTPPPATTAPAGEPARHADPPLSPPPP